jgi:hypothetical protein
MRSASDDDSFGTPHVAQPVGVLVNADGADQFEAIRFQSINGRLEIVPLMT